MSQAGRLDILGNDADDGHQLLHILAQLVALAGGDDDGCDGEPVAGMEALHQRGNVVLQPLFVDDDEIVLES